MLRAWLELARISNLPTVWTNVLAGWLLAGGTWQWGPLAWLLAGGSLLYTAGMILNDAMDVKFDREHRKERPIPSGRVSAETAWVAGIAMLLVGAAMCFFGGGACGWLVLALVAAIMAYDAFHKPWAGSVFIMGACRALLYLVAGSAVTGGPGLGDLPELVRKACSVSKAEASEALIQLEPLLVWLVKSIALGGYIVGVTLVARGESKGNRGSTAGLILGFVCLLMPIGGWFVGVLAGPHFSSWLRSPVVWIALQFLLPILFAGLVWFAVKRMRTPPPSNIGRAVGLLLAGIVVVDATAISMGHPFVAVVFAASMPLLLLWQRKIAAT